MSDAPRILVIIGSMRQGRAADRVVAWFRSITDQRTDLVFEYIDLKDWPLPFFADPGLPSQVEHEYKDDLARRWVEKIESGDGFILVTPEYNHGYPAALKNALDYVYAGWNNKPVAFVSYAGLSGGIRAIEQLKQVALDLQLHPVRADVTIPFINRAFDEQGKAIEPSLEKRAQAMLDQLAWWTNILKSARAQHPFPGKK